MKKKIIYFHFDYEKYRNTHPAGYFDYKNNGFGPIVNDIDSLVNCIINYKDNTYLSRVNDFFGHVDKNNCERTLNEILNIKD
jgi:CDP-glycerol glycerophosphotransferase (TagB/SpsB family)